MDYKPLRSGLYVVPTPIGNLKDITIRSLEVLKNCDVIFCEDTRVTSKLLNAYGIQKPLFIYQEHNEQQAKHFVLEKIQQNQAVCLVSDAGTPLICDPGYKLINFLNQQNIYITFLPGPSALIPALGLSGMPSNQFFFAGFFDNRSLDEIAGVSSSIIFYESPKRVLKTLQLIAQKFPKRKVAVVREISKIYEEAIRGEIEEVINIILSRDLIKGEIAIVLEPLISPPSSNLDAQEYIKYQLKNHSVKDVVSLSQNKFSINKKEAYKLVLKIFES